MPDGPLPPEVVARFLARCRAERVAAGKPVHLEDPTVLSRVAAIVAADHRAHQERRVTDQAAADESAA